MKKKFLLMLIFFVTLIGNVNARSWGGIEFRYYSWDEFYDYMNRAYETYDYVVIYVEYHNKNFPEELSSLPYNSLLHSESFSYTTGRKSLHMYFYYDYDEALYHYQKASPKTVKEPKLFRLSSQAVQLTEYWNYLLNKWM